MGHDRQRAEFRQYQREQQHLYRDLGAYHLQYGSGGAGGAAGLVYAIASLSLTLAQSALWLIALPVRLVLRRRRRDPGE